MARTSFSGLTIPPGASSLYHRFAVMTSNSYSSSIKAVLRSRFRVACLLLIGPMAPGFGLQADQARLETGFVTRSDGARLYYTKVGNGPRRVILPGRLFLLPDFLRLARGRTLIFYDMRNRGLSDAVDDMSKIS